MRRQIRLVTAGVAAALVAGGITWFVVQPQPEAFSTSAGAVWNLQTALRGARIYYTDSGRTFLGLTNSASLTTSSIQEISTHLNFVSGGLLTSGNLISTDVGGHGSYLILASFGSPEDCWGILDVAKPQPAPILGISGSAFPGLYWFVIRGTTTSACNAAEIKSVSASSTADFPHR
jgi:hypothetical protein